MGVKLPKGFCKRCGSRLAGQGVWCDEHRPGRKLRNRPTAEYDSLKEERRGRHLANLQRAGVIRNLERQVPFVIVINGVRVAKYIADFVYEICEKSVWRKVVEDVKGHRTAYYKLKSRLFRACFGFPISEV